MCEYCENEERILTQGNKYNLSLDIFIKNDCLWEKTFDMGVEINFCPMCGRKLGDE